MLEGCGFNSICCGSTVLCWKVCKLYCHSHKCLIIIQSNTTAPLILNSKITMNFTQRWSVSLSTKRIGNLSILKCQKCQIFPSSFFSSFSDELICFFLLFYMTVNWISFGLRQNKQSVNIMVGSGKLLWLFSDILRATGLTEKVHELPPVWHCLTKLNIISFAMVVFIVQLFYRIALKAADVALIVSILVSFRTVQNVHLGIL